MNRTPTDVGAQFIAPETLHANMDKKIIRNNFSRNADSYDDHAAVQKRCAEKLIELIRGKQFRRILEVGCGTGIYTKLLRDEYADAQITALDISGDMVEIAQKKFSQGDVAFMVADGEQIRRDEKLDLITSNASFQWFERFGTALELFARTLADDGVLCFSMYGPETFKEFEEVLGRHFGGRPWLSSSRFVSRETTEVILKKHFKNFDLVEEHFTVDFFSLWDFLKDIKHSGARGEGLGGGRFLGKYVIKELEKTYIEKFGGITATHHVYFCKAQI
ncbi:MAG: malonyl-ACP O-methyltransferase BioC [Candidatus Omnitrophota bacterium]